MAKAKIKLNHDSVFKHGLAHSVKDIIDSRTSLLGDLGDHVDKFSKKKYTITGVDQGGDFTLTLKGTFKLNESDNFFITKGRGRLEGMVKNASYTYKKDGLTSSFKVSGIKQTLGESDFLSSEAIFNKNDKFIINSGLDNHEGLAVKDRNFTQHLGQGNDEVILNGGGVFAIYPGDLLTPSNGSKKLTIALKKGRAPKVALYHGVLAPGSCSDLDATVVLKGFKEFDNSYGADLANKTNLISDSLGDDHVLLDSWCPMSTFEITS